jgi:hypothetical protein
MAPATQLRGLCVAAPAGPDGASGRLRVSAATLARLGATAAVGSPLLLTVTAAAAGTDHETRPLTARVPQRQQRDSREREREMPIPGFGRARAPRQPRERS